MEVGARAEAGIDEPPIFKRLVGSAVGLLPPLLEIRTVIPRQAEELEISLDAVDVLAAGALTVEILDAQHDAPALGLGDEPRHQRGEDVAGMHASSGGRREPPHHGSAVGCGR